MQIVLEYKKPTSQVYFENIFNNFNFDWNKIYILPRLVTLDSVLRSSQYKVLHNILFLNQKLFLFRTVSSPLCSFCNREEETILHTFYSCIFTKALWNDLKNSVEGFLQLPDLTTQSTMFGFLDINTNVYLISNHLLLIFKFYVYKARSIKEVNFNILKRKIKKVQEKEKIYQRIMQINTLNIRKNGKF